MRTYQSFGNRWRGFYDSPSVVVDTEKNGNNGEGKQTITATVKKTSSITCTVTAYCGCIQCCGKSDKITASGVMATEGITVAADTNVLPFDTKIEIDGNVYTVQDRGGAIKGNRIDIYFESHERALQYGRQTKEVTILKGE